MVVFSIRARLHETRRELKPVWDFTSVWGNFIISVHITSGVVKLTSVNLTVNVRSEIKLRRIIKVDN